MRRIVIAGLLFLLTTGCGLDHPNPQGLRPGKYRVQFDIAAAPSVPAPAVGHHDFLFAVSLPMTDALSFSLLSAVKGDGSLYLNAEQNVTIPTPSQWEVSWRFIAAPALRVSVVMKEEADGTFSLPSGCHVRTDDQDFVGTNCNVVRAD